jgi:hypothetical protein
MKERATTIYFKVLSQLLSQKTEKTTQKATTVSSIARNQALNILYKIRSVTHYTTTFGHMNYKELPYA